MYTHLGGARRCCKVQVCVMLRADTWTSVPCQRVLSGYDDPAGAAIATIHHFASVLVPQDRKVAMLLYGFPPNVGATGTAALLNVPKVSLVRMSPAYSRVHPPTADRFSCSGTPTQCSHAARSLWRLCLATSWRLAMTWGTTAAR